MLKSALSSLNRRWKASEGKGLGKYAGQVKEIPIHQIRVIPEVFQPRFTGNDSKGIQSKDHVFSLNKRLEREGLLDPLLVLPVGNHAFVIDGHHRLEAYKKANIANVTALIFGGDAFEAKLESAKENQKIRLPMSVQERSQSAWNLVKEGMVSINPPKWVYSENQILQSTGASDKTIKSMRAIYKKYRAKGMAVPDSWISARQGTDETLDRDWDAELEEQVEKYRKALLKAIPKLTTSRKREAFAMAVVSFSPQSTQEILRYIIQSDEGQEALEATQDELFDQEDQEDSDS